MIKQVVLLLIVFHLAMKNDPIAHLNHLIPIYLYLNKVLYQVEENDSKKKKPNKTNYSKTNNNFTIYISLILAINSSKK